MKTKKTNLFFQFLKDLYYINRNEFLKLRAKIIINRAILNKYPDIKYAIRGSPCDSYTLDILFFSIDNKELDIELHDFVYEYLYSILKDDPLLLCHVKNSEITKEFYSEYL